MYSVGTETGGSEGDGGEAVTWTLLQGDCLEQLKTLPDESIHGVDGQLGLEPTPDEYVAKMVEVFREVKRLAYKPVFIA